jgi:hypothetical protein
MDVPARSILSGNDPALAEPIEPQDRDTGPLHVMSQA